MGYKVSCDATQTESRNYPPIEPGDYIIQCVDFKEKVTKTGKPMLSVAFEICPNQKSAGAWVWHNLTIIPKGEKGHGMMVHFLKQMGQPFDGDIDVEPDNFVGRQLQVRLKETEYQGKKKAEIDEIYSRQDAPVNTEDSEIPF